MNSGRGNDLARFLRGWRSQRARRPRILGLLAFRDEMRFLPGYFENIAPHVDGIVALDDGSTDGSAEFVASQPSVLELLRKPATQPHIWNDSENHRMLVQASWRYEPDWLIGVDADERLERTFRSRALREIERAEREGYSAYSVIMRELWDHPDTYRADGIWGRKRVARFFKARPDHEFHQQRLHCHWAPLNSQHNGVFPKANLVIYHLRMIDEADRRARRDRYNRLDPDRCWQASGYDYLTDEDDLRLEGLPLGREYEPLGRGPSTDEGSAAKTRPAPNTSTPSLACVVLSLGNHPSLVAAVRSLLAQNEPIELVVVNSGGGDPAAALREAGIEEIEVINRQERLYPGAARNLGIDATRAPYVSFLAADCAAEAGWASERLREHRAGALAVASAITNPYPYNRYAWASQIQLFARRMPSVPPEKRLLYGVSYARELFERFGKFREDLRTGEDTEFNRRFATTVPISWSSEVRTTHEHSTDFFALIRDQYARGRRRARAAERTSGKWLGRVIAKNALRQITHSARIAWLAAEPGDRRRMVGAWPLLPLAAAAYALGALLSPRLDPETKAQDERVRFLEQQLLRRDRQLQRLKSKNKRLKLRVRNLHQQLQSVKSSRTWRLLGALSRVRSGMFRVPSPKHRTALEIAQRSRNISKSGNTSTTHPSSSAKLDIQPAASHTPSASKQPDSQVQKLKQAHQSLGRNDEEIAELGMGDTRSITHGIRPENIVWIFGHQRTGSSWLASMMNTLHDHTLWDEPLVGALFGRIYHELSGKRNDKHFILGSHKEIWLNSIRNFVLDGAGMRFPEVADGGYLVAKEPHSALGAPLLMEALPESRMILLVRDPRDVVASSLDAHRKGSWGWEIPEADEQPDTFVATRAEVYLRDIRHAQQAFDAHSGRKVLVRYEDLRADTLNTLRRIYSTLEIPVDKEELARVVKKHSWENIPEDNKGPGKKRRKATPGSWREDLTFEQVDIVERQAAPVLKEFYS